MQLTKNNLLAAVLLGVALSYLLPSSPAKDDLQQKPRFIFDFDYSIWTDSRSIVESLSVDRQEWCRNRLDCRLLAEAIVYESRGEPLEGQYAVAWVIKNRAEGSNRFPDGIVEVIRQPYQFSYLQDLYKQTTPSAASWRIARRVAYNTLNEVVASPIGKATHYHANYVKPHWSTALPRVATVGNHIYYRE